MFCEVMTMISYSGKRSIHYTSLNSETVIWWLCNFLASQSKLPFHTGRIFVGEILYKYFSEAYSEVMKMTHSIQVDVYRILWASCRVCKLIILCNAPSDKWQFSSYVCIMQYADGKMAVCKWYWRRNLMVDWNEILLGDHLVVIMLL